MDFKGSQFERDIILWGVRWYVAYPISYRHLEEMMHERGVEVDHSSLNRWVLKFSPPWARPFGNASEPWAQAGAWMKPSFASQAKGSIGIGPSTKPVMR